MLAYIMPFCGLDYVQYAVFVQVSLLSRIHHRNLVAFLGYCHEDGRNILVYEFMMNGTLKEHLHGNPFSFIPIRSYRQERIAF